MNYQLSVQNLNIDAEIQLPASKSICNRALIINALSNSVYPVKNLSDSDDTDVLYKALNSNGRVFDIGAAGTAMRFITAYLSKIMGEWVVTGSERMKQRPIGVLVDALCKLGAQIEYVENEGYPPLRIFGSALQGGDIELPGDISSQYITALLLIAPTLQKGLKVKMSGEVISTPYINLTLKMMEEFGVKSEWKGDVIHVPAQEYKPIQYACESDWSAASYWYEVVALNPSAKITLKGLHRYSFQGDSKIAELFAKLGVKTEFTKQGVLLTNSGQVASVFNYNFVEQPDMAQTFAVVCCVLGVKFKFDGLQTLRIKETDRIYALIDELKKMGFVLTTNGKDNLEWDGATCEFAQNPSIATYKDHRMAMAFAPVVFTNRYNMIIEDPAVVSKSYPKYWDHLKQVGVEISSM